MWSVYADGSSTGRSDKPGGYGYVVVSDGEVIDSGNGGSPSTTNNLMEMEALIQGILAIHRLDPDNEQEVELVSDSQYALGIASGEYTPKKNLTQALKLRNLAKSRDFKFRWVRGHSGDTWNEEVDKLAKSGKLDNTPEQ